MLTHYCGKGFPTNTLAATGRHTAVTARWACAGRFWGDEYHEFLPDLPGLLGAVGPARVILLIRHPEEVMQSQFAWTGTALAAGDETVCWVAAADRGSARLPHEDGYCVSQLRVVGGRT